MRSFSQLRLLKIGASFNVAQDHKNIFFKRVFGDTFFLEKTFAIIYVSKT